MKQKIRWIMLIIALVLFGIIVYCLNVGKIHAFDNYIYNVISKTISPVLTTIAIIITNIGGTIGVAIVTLLLMIFMKNRNHKKYILINLAIILLSNQALKYLFVRERPNINRLVEVTGFSFPSGHSMVNAAFYGFLVYLAYKYIENKRTRNIIIALLLLLILLIGLSRVYLGVHYASDVVGGFAISTAYLMIFTVLIRQKLD